MYGAQSGNMMVAGTQYKYKSSAPLSDKTSKTNGMYVCHYCDASFRIRGYLTRHIKKHSIEKAYHCPFYNEHQPSELKCHNSGGFSRRDTYKTHLKSRHILYPKGVKQNERNKSTGHCAQCGEFFQNLDHWVETHIESGECTALPSNYVKKQTRNLNTKLKQLPNNRYISMDEDKELPLPLDMEQSPIDISKYPLDYFIQQPTKKSHTVDTTVCLNTMKGTIEYLNMYNDYFNTDV
ncbi:hypothetical protein KAFR_0A06720 [Kazachstania africana CBS 2517]|uniref:Transcription factor STP1 n=1 Tax=Kazachstania africana (strain ATCC 22294 / BCRC 22015 / CBS 2517 / CECT 1963 / NBRC 1671 / NRRL Y-8276) TaxID=1071382 RepID=H2AP07_KAZAF|nr:hypothetical protein KAFR_0A06720 [Kazachstania africana CBS 2517]CCF56107.1 hypothetical protein KAFR_0A06720 [Kazachstania africana CBS 2517]